MHSVPGSARVNARAQSLSIALCILTFRRPDGLQRLLTAVAGLDVADLDTDIRVVVVDNDPAGSGRAAAEEVRAGFPFPLVVDVEPQPGIPFARNRAVALAGEVDVLGWLDDDEVPHPDWLRLLVTELRRTGADVVIGPSVPHLPPGTPAWVDEGAFFHRRRFPTGTAIPPHHARTSGVLVRRAALPPRPRPFNDDLALTGGSDRELFVEMGRAGARFRWVDEAVMVEHVPAARARLGWILRRAFRIGNSRSTTLVLQRPSLLQRLKRVAGGLLHLATGALHAGRAVAHARGRAAVVHGLWTSAYGAGLITGALGGRYEEYRRAHRR